MLSIPVAGDCQDTWDETRVKVAYCRTREANLRSGLMAVPNELG